MGSNSSHRVHIRQHYALYSKRCAESGIKEHERCVPPAVLAQRRLAMRPPTQKLLPFAKVTTTRVTQFSPEHTLHQVAMLVVANDHPLTLANQTAFHNALVSMRPRTKLKELPTAHTVKVHIHNEFIAHLKNAIQAIKVSGSQSYLSYISPDIHLGCTWAHCDYQ